MTLAERGTFLGKKVWVREVRKKTQSGGQTSILSTDYRTDLGRIAAAMFARWSQENFFRYMREEYGLDHLVTNDVEPADVERLVPNPEKKEKRKLIKGLKQELEGLIKDYGCKALQNDERHLPTNPDYKNEILEVKKQIKQSETDLKQIPDRIAVKQLLAKHEIDRLETERKMFTDAVKMVCYRAETSLLNLIGHTLPAIKMKVAHS